jgi:mono/diheme cytochrome c family protein
VSYPRISLGFGIVGATLVLVAVLFAWGRSGSGTASASLAAGTAAAAVPATPSPLGAEAYAVHCSSCHRQGEPRGRSIPPLRGFAVELLLAEGGREYLVDFLFDGRVRHVTDGEVSFEASHPEFRELSDEEAAAVLNYMLTSWGNAKLLPEETLLYTRDEVAGRRRALE